METIYVLVQHCKYITEIPTYILCNVQGGYEISDKGCPVSGLLEAYIISS